MLRLIEDRLGRGLKVAMTSVFAGLVLVAGFAFLVAAGYQVTVLWLGTPWAALVIGGALIVVALLMLLVLRLSRPKPPPVTPAAVIAAFMAGVQAGRGQSPKAD